MFFTPKKFDVLEFVRSLTLSPQLTPLLFGGPREICRLIGRIENIVYPVAVELLLPVQKVFFQEMKNTVTIKSLTPTVSSDVINKLDSLLSSAKACNPVLLRSRFNQILVGDISVVLASVKSNNVGVTSILHEKVMTALGDWFNNVLEKFDLNIIEVVILL